ncbi:hypothetical protein D5274_04730 [bacterium 1XD42-94]|nr:hypothetical protein [bacterium 1XD42-94]
MTRRTEKTGRNRPPAAGAVGSFSAGTACGYGDAQARPIRKMKKTASGFRAAKKEGGVRKNEAVYSRRGGRMA